MDSLIQLIAISAIPVIFAITVHEAAHGYAARYFGDHTAEKMGRLSFNPIRHIDPVGTVLVPALSLLMGGILFGWAKPVPVDFRNLRNPKKNMLWVAAAGPGSNFLMAIVWGFIWKFAGTLDGNTYQVPLALMAEKGVQINVVLMALNLVPIPPLDGGRILVSLLPNQMAWQVSRIEPWGMLIVLALMFTHVLSFILAPLIAAAFAVLNLIL